MDMMGYSDFFVFVGGGGVAAAAPNPNIVYYYISNQNYFQILLANCILLLPKLLRSILQRALSILLFMLRPIAITQ